jgi:type IV pilus assembly protein PilC
MTQVIDLSAAADGDAGPDDTAGREAEPKKKLRRSTLMNFSRQLAAFMAAGISITEALRVLRANTRDPRMVVLVDGLADGVRRGATIADTLESLPSQVPPYYVPMVRAGEATGRLDEVLMHLADDLDRDQTMRRKIQSAVTYPTVVLCVGIAVVMIMIIFVLPRYEQFFRSIDADLPLMTRLLLKTGSIGTVPGLLAIAVVLTGVLAAVVWARTPDGRQKLHRAVLKVPIVGEMAQYIAVERFCRSLCAMLAAGTPLPLGLAVSADATGNSEFVDRLTEVRQAVLAGASLGTAIETSGVFPPPAVQMIRVGEETGALDDLLDKTAEYYGRELTFALTRFTTFFETGIIIAIALAVGFVAVALVSAMFGIYRQVGV